MVNSHRVIRNKQWNLINGHYDSIMRKENDSKECGENNFHGISVVPPTEKIKVQGAFHHHNINTDYFPYD